MINNRCVGLPLNLKAAKQVMPFNIKQNRSTPRFNRLSKMRFKRTIIPKFNCVFKTTRIWPFSTQFQCNAITYHISLYMFDTEVLGLAELSIPLTSMVCVDIGLQSRIRFGNQSFLMDFILDYYVTV